MLFLKCFLCSNQENVNLTKGIFSLRRILLHYIVRFSNLEKGFQSKIFQPSLVSQPCSLK